MSFDQPFVVVAAGELQHGLAQICNVFVEARPQALLLEGSDEAFRAAVARRLAGEGRAVLNPEPSDRSLEVARGVLRSPVMSQ
jgi:hypothetical protein